MSALIAGGGVAGAAAACLLGSAATLIEREPGPHDKVCGEFVSWEAQAALERLGLDLAGLSGAPIWRVRLVHGTRVAVSDLPGVGLGVSRRRLDEALLELAAGRGAQVIRGHAVRRALPHALEVDGLGRLEAERVLLATGKHEMRGMARATRPGDLVGFKMHYRLRTEQQAALAGHVEIVLFPGGYAGLQPIEDGRANLCLLIRRAAFDEAGSTWSGVLTALRRSSPHLLERLAQALELFARPLSIFRVPYGYVHRTEDGVARLGDQMGVIPSFSGDGMAIALHTAVAAARCPEAAAYHRAMRRDLTGQVGRAMALHRAGLATPGLVTVMARAWPGALALIARLTRVHGAGAGQSAARFETRAA